MPTIVVGRREGHAVIVNRDRTVASIEAAAVAVRVPNNAAVGYSVKDTKVARVAAPGPQGPKGDPGDQSTITRAAASILSGYRIMRSVNATTVDYADATNAAHGDDTLGISLNAAAGGDPVNVQRNGSVTFAGWSWTPLEPIYLGANGTMTQTPPAAEGGFAFAQQLGYAESQNTLFLDPQQPIYL